MSAATPVRRAPGGVVGRRRGSRGARAALAASAGVALAVVACVEIQTAPGGIASIGLGALPPSIVAGDVLRDTLGREVRLRAVAYDGSGTAVEGATFRYAALPAAGRDTVRVPVAVVVDSVTGAVRAIAPRPATSARVGARLGDRLQILDTLAVVLRPTRLRRAERVPAEMTLRYLCTDTSRLVVADTALGNATPALAALLTADSAAAGDTAAVPVPSSYVQYRIVAPTAVPTGISPYGDRRPAFYLTGSNSDRPLAFDTTGATGETATRLRVLPSLLPRAAAPDEVSVRIEATARGGERPLADTVRFTVRLVRRPPTNGSCP